MNAPLLLWMRRERDERQTYTHLIMEDQEIIKDVLDGNRDAFAGLVHRYHPKVIQLCISLLSHQTLAEDAAQEVFIKAYQKLNQFRAQSKFSTWLYRMTYNHCLDMLRSQTRQKLESWDELVEKEGDKLHGMMSTSKNPMENYDDKDLVARVLSTLHPDYKHILLLREVQGLSYEEIARTMECTIDSVKARLRRAREDLQHKISPFLETGKIEATLSPPSKRLNK